jgi:hypothetical protein
MIPIIRGVAPRLSAHNGITTDNIKNWLLVKKATA